MDKQAQYLFSEYISGDSIIQLRNGKLIFHYFNKYDYYINIYDEKTFHQLFEISLDEIILKYKQEIEKNKGNLKNEGDNEKEEIKDKNNNVKKNSIKELKNGKILIGDGKYLFELNIYKKSYSCNIVKKMDYNILDINEISEKGIVIITNKKIFVLKKENLEYIIKDEYLLKDNWKIIPMSSTHKYYKQFKQNFSTYVLPNDKLLLNSFSTELRSNGHCGNFPPTEISNSKIIFIDFKNFEEITSTKTFEIDAKHIIFENIIVIQAYDEVIIYDINSLKIINNIKLEAYYGYMYKYDNQYLLAIPKHEDKNNIVIYKIENNDLVKHGKIKANLSFEKIYGRSHYPVTTYNNKYLLTLKDKRVLITCHNKIYLLNLELD